MSERIDFAGIAEPVSRDLFGEPNKKLSKAGELRFGSNGSIKVATTGEAAGTFVNFETGESGGLLDLIASKIGGDHSEAVKWLGDHGFIDREGGNKSQRLEDRIDAIYPYADENGKKLYEVLRLKNPKSFRQRQSETVWHMNGCRLVPYHLPRLLRAVRDESTIFIVEGEKDVERLALDDAVATTNTGGAGRWKAEFASYFGGADVVILPDNDKAGQDHADKVARALKGHAKRIRLINLPGLPEKGDVSDWFDAGNDIHALWREVEAAQDWKPTSRLGLTFFGDEDRFAARRWLVKGLLGQSEMSVIYAPSGGGKSFFALDLAAHVAAGLEWNNHQVTQSGVLYVCGEGASGFRNRMKAWRKVHDPGNIPFAMLARSLDLLSPIASKATSEAIEIVKEAMVEVNEASGMPVRFIVLDTASRMMPGGVDSEPRDMKAFLDNVEMLREETGAHILIIHHSGKDKERGMRGSSMLRDYADCVIEIAPGEEAPSVAKVDKMKDGEDGTRYRFTLEQMTIGLDSDGEEIVSCAVKSEGRSQASEPVKSKRLPDDVENARRALADLLGDESVTGVMRRVTDTSRSAEKCVTLDQWKEACRARSLIEEGDKGRQQWKRLKDKMLRLNLIGIERELVWLA